MNIVAADGLVIGGAAAVVLTLLYPNVPLLEPQRLLWSHELKNLLEFN